MAKKMAIIQNEVKCLDCGDQIYSAHRHDYKKCKCGKVGVDGGLEYIRRTYSDDANFKDLSILITEEILNKTKEAIKWSNDNNRNELGTICAIFRAFRDCGYELKKKEMEIDKK